MFMILTRTWSSPTSGTGTSLKIISPGFFAVDASKVTPIPEEMSYEEGAMIEPLAVAVHAVKQMGDVKGMNITVIGAGPIGNLVAQTAKGMGAARVMITDVSDLRLDKAKAVLESDGLTFTREADYMVAEAGSGTYHIAFEQ